MLHVQEGKSQRGPNLKNFHEKQKNIKEGEVQAKESWSTDRGDGQRLVRTSARKRKSGVWMGDVELQACLREIARGRERENYWGMGEHEKPQASWWEYSQIYIVDLKKKKKFRSGFEWMMKRSSETDFWLKTENCQKRYRRQRLYCTFKSHQSQDWLLKIVTETLPGTSLGPFTLLGKLGCIKMLYFIMFQCWLMRCGCRVWRE